MSSVHNWSQYSLPVHTRYWWSNIMNQFKLLQHSQFSKTAQASCEESEWLSLPYVGLDWQNFQLNLLVTKGQATLVPGGGEYCPPLPANVRLSPWLSWFTREASEKCRSPAAAYIWCLWWGNWGKQLASQFLSSLIISTSCFSHTSPQTTGRCNSWGGKFLQLIFASIVGVLICLNSAYQADVAPILNQTNALTPWTYWL